MFFLLLLNCGSPPHIESSIVPKEQPPKKMSKMEEDVKELKTVTTSLQKDMSEMNSKVDNLEKMVMEQMKEDTKETK